MWKYALKNEEIGYKLREVNDVCPFLSTPVTFLTGNLKLGWLEKRFNKGNVVQNLELPLGLELELLKKGHGVS